MDPPLPQYFDYRVNEAAWRIQRARRPVTPFIHSAALTLPNGADLSNGARRRAETVRVTVRLDLWPLRFCPAGWKGTSSPQKGNYREWRSSQATVLASSSPRLRVAGPYLFARAARLPDFIRRPVSEPRCYCHGPRFHDASFLRRLVLSFRSSDEFHRIYTDYSWLF